MEYTYREIMSALEAHDETLDLITAALDGQDWDADTLDTIASLIRATGRTIHEVPADREARTTER